MQRLDVEYDFGRIEEFLDADSLSRNKNLSVMLNFLNNVDGQFVINLDDDWGTGKTVFLKQIEFLSHTKKENLSNINLKNLKEFQEKYIVFYFNAWEQDLYGNPLESLVYSLLMELSEMSSKKVVEEDVKEIISTKLKELGLLGSNLLIKTITSGSIELKDLKFEKEDLSPVITSVNVKRDAIASIVSMILEESDKKMLIIIDELDRCKPTYAINLLEIIKHFFVNDDVVFLFGSNKKELAETIKKEYGSSFDGYKYLNRFFDFEFTLPAIDIEGYLCNVGGGSYSQSHYYKIEMETVATYLNFTMRDLNRYISICNMFLSYWRGSSSRLEPYQTFIFIPFAIGLKINNGCDYKNFINGEGEELLIKFYEHDISLHNKIISHTVEKRLKDNENLDEQCKIELIKFYKELKLNYTKKSERNKNYRITEFLDVLSMMSDFT